MVGEKLTVNEQDAPPARVYGGGVAEVAPQLVEVCWKSPLSWKLEIVMGLVVVFFSVMVW